MHDQYDAIIIGAATAFELAKLGYRTLSVDRLPAAGYGPTSSSCAIIRAHYSTFDGSEDPECGPREFVDPDDYVRDFTEQGTTQAHRYGQRVPSPGIPSSLRGVVDLYDASDDWIPIYDRSRVPGFYMAVGTSGNQFKNAPVAGKMMAALIDYCERGNDHDVRPLAFHLEHIGRTVNAGFYSRKRESNKESSFSVLG